MALFILGDVHFGVGDEKKLLTLDAKADDIAIICGDAGFVWNGDDWEGGRDYAVLERVNALGFTVCFVDGNHEGFTALNRYPIVEFNGGKAHKLRDNVYHLMRGEIFNLQGKICWTFGGATSVDKYRRVEGVSWWKEELPTNEEIMYGYDKIMAVGEVDYIITHQVPQWTKEVLFPFYSNLDDAYMMKMFDEVYRNVHFKHWWAGHYHVDKNVDKIRILYHDVIQIN